MDIPAFCNACGTAFRSGLNISGPSIVTLSGNSASPCPACGGTGRIPDGVFNVFNETLEILSAPGRTVTDLSRLKGLLQSARNQKQQPEDFAKTIERELPQLSAFSLLIPKTPSDFYAFLQVILILISMLIPDSPKSNVTINQHITINQVINQIHSDSDRVTKGQSPSKSKIGRNDPCSCGSGKKHKKCCGQ